MTNCILKREEESTLAHTTSSHPSSITDLPQHDDAVLRAPVGGDVKHAGAVAPDDPVVHLRVLADVGVHGADHSHRPSELNGLGHSELVEGCERENIQRCE